jgi:starch phosphorylase
VRSTPSAARETARGLDRQNPEPTASSRNPRLGREHETFPPLLDELLGRDRFFNCADFASYVETQERASQLYGTEAWTRISILNVAGMGYFSSDRAIREYAVEIWNVKPVPVRFEG